MTKEFDPTRPCRYRCGEEPLAVFVLPEPQEDGETIVSVCKAMYSHTHFPNGQHIRTEPSDLDLINIPEEVTMAAWMVVDPTTDRRIGPWDSEEDARAHLLHDWEIVVRMTGVYTR